MHDHPFATLVTPARRRAALSARAAALGRRLRAARHAARPFRARQSACRARGGRRIDRDLPRPARVRFAVVVRRARGAVPTWNYAVVHAHGTLELAREPAETRAILDLLIHRFESGRAAPWQLGLDRARLDAMVGAIVGFRMKIKRIDAKFKLSQNRPPDDRARVAAALDGRGLCRSRPRPPRGCAPTSRPPMASADDRGRAAAPDASASTSGCGRRASTGRAASPRRRSTPGRRGSTASASSRRTPCAPASACRCASTASSSRSSCTALVRPARLGDRCREALSRDGGERRRARARRRAGAQAAATQPALRRPADQARAAQARGFSQRAVTRPPSTRAQQSRKAARSSSRSGFW